MPAAKKNVPWHIQIPVITFEVAVMDLVVKVAEM
jgi:hypothetical protein